MYKFVVFHGNNPTVLKTVMSKRPWWEVQSVLLFPALPPILSPPRLPPP